MCNNILLSHTHTHTSIDTHPSWKERDLRATRVLAAAIPPSLIDFRDHRPCAQLTFVPIQQQQTLSFSLPRDRLSIVRWQGPIYGAHIGGGGIFMRLKRSCVAHNGERNKELGGKSIEKLDRDNAAKRNEDGNLL